MKRIIVIGSGEAGKSTFAIRLGNALNINVIHLDKLYWKANWVKTPADEWPGIVEELLKGDAWVMDGKLGGARELRMRARDTIIFLDIVRHVCLYRILKPAIVYHGKTRPDLPEGCNERFDVEFVLWVWNYADRSRVRVLEQLKLFADKNVVILRSNREIESFLLALR